MRRRRRRRASSGHAPTVCTVSIRGRCAIAPRRSASFKPPATPLARAPPPTWTTMRSMWAPAAAISQPSVCPPSIARPFRSPWQVKGSAPSAIAWRSRPTVGSPGEPECRSTDGDPRAERAESRQHRQVGVLGDEHLQLRRPAAATTPAASAALPQLAIASSGRSSGSASRTPDCDEQLFRVHSAAVVQLDRDPPAVRNPLGEDPRVHLDPVRSRSEAATLLSAKGSSREGRRVSPSTRATSVPNVDHAWASSEPMGRRRARPCLAAPVWRSSYRGSSPVPNRVEPVERRHRRAAAGRHHHGLAGDQLLLANGDPALAVEPPSPRNSSMPAFLEPGQLDGVVEVVDHLVAAVEDRLGVESRWPLRRPAPGGPRPAARRGAAAPSTACRRSRSTRRRPGGSTIATREPALGQPSGADLARRGRPRSRSRRILSRESGYPTRPRTMEGRHSMGTTGFDLVIRANGCRSRLPEASLNTGTNQYVRTMSSPSLLS